MASKPSLSSARFISKESLLVNILASKGSILVPLGSVHLIGMRIV